MSRRFKRSSQFGLIGVFVVAALAVVIATTMGQGDPNPKLALGLIFGVIAIFFVILFALQRSDLERAAGSDAAATNRAAAEGEHRVENPMTMAEPDLWAALAIAPIDADAIRARDEVWDVGRRSIRLGMVIVAAPGPEWSARSRDGRVRAAEGASDAVVAALQGVPDSVRWKRVEVHGGPEGIVVTRKKGEMRDWLCDLWLAERLARS